MSATIDRTETLWRQGFIAPWLRRELASSMVTLDLPPWLSGQPEEWRDVPGCDAYQVSSYGSVRRSKPGTATFVGRPVRPTNSPTGYAMVRLSAAGSRQVPLYVHRAVMLAFVGPCPAGHVVNHRDGNKRNNRLANLEYVTHAENNRHARETLPRHRGPSKPRAPKKGPQTGDAHWSRRHPEKVARGERMGGSKLSADQVADIKLRAANGERQRALAAEFNVSVAQVSRIVRGMRWAHVRAS